MCDEFLASCLLTELDDCIFCWDGVFILISSTLACNRPEILYAVSKLSKYLAFQIGGTMNSSFSHTRHGTYSSTKIDSENISFWGMNYEICEAPLLTFGKAILAYQHYFGGFLSRFQAHHPFVIYCYSMEYFT